MIAAFTRFDLAGLVASRSRVLAPLLVVVLAAFGTPLSVLAIPAGAVIVSLQAGTTFLGDERGRLDLLYGVLPLRRRSVVVGRYLTMLVEYAVVELLATALALVGAAVRGGAVDGPALAALHAASFLAVALALAVQLPCFFALGFTRGRPMMYIPVAVLAAALWLGGRIGLLDGSSSAALAGPPAAIGAVVLGGLLLAGSAALSARLYGRRSL